MALPAPILHMPLDGNLSLKLGTGSATFTRSTTGTYVDQVDGLVKSAAINTPRFEKNGILIEGASTNEALHSRDFTDAVHVKTNITALKDAVGVDGVTNSASTLTATDANGTVFQTVTKASAENTFSIDIRRKTGTGTIEISDDGGVGYTDVTSSLNSSTYTRFTITTTQANPSFGLRIGTSGDEVEVDYEGLEELPFATSRIDTTTIAVARTADDLSIPFTGNMPAPTLDYSTFSKVDVLGFDSSQSPRIYQVAGETDRFLNVVGSTSKVNGKHGAVTSAATTSLVANTQALTAFVVDSTNQTLYLDGAQEDQDAKGTVTGTATSIDIGNNAGASYLYGHLKDFKIFDVALSDTQALELTSAPSLVTNMITDIISEMIS
jgi:hypothetical protein